MFAKLVRLGRDAEVRFTPKGDPVASLAMVYDIGFGDNKQSQWLDGTLWGKRAESLGPYLTKGSQIVVYADDLQLEQFMKKDGNAGAKLKCRITDLSLVSGQQSSGAPNQNQAPQSQPMQSQAPQQRPPQQGNYGPVDQHGNLEDIPF